jgi:hypothetical protein
VVALLDLGETVLEPLDVRSTDAIQSAACALGADMGRYLTTVKACSTLIEPRHPWALLICAHKP